MTLASALLTCGSTPSVKRRLPSSFVLFLRAFLVCRARGCGRYVGMGCRERKGGREGKKKGKALGRRCPPICFGGNHINNRFASNPTHLPIFPPLPPTISCTASNGRAVPSHGLRQPGPSSPSSPHPPPCRGGLDGGRAARTCGRREGGRERGRGGADAAEGGETDGGLAGRPCDISGVKVNREGREGW